MAYAQVDGINMYYSMPRGIAQHKEQVMALLIHGGGGSTRHWEPLVAQLPAQFCPLIIDLPGHGHSGGTVLHSLEQTAIVLDHFLQSLALKQPLWCIGHSMGGLLAQYFALHYPAYIERLVLIATAARIRLHRDFVQAALIGQWNLELFRSSFGSDIPLAIQNLVLHEYPKMRAMHDVDFMGLNALDLHSEISALQMPVLLIVGGDDVIISPRHSRTLFQALPHATLLTIPDGGHYVHVEQPQCIAQILTQLLQEAPSPI